MNSTLEIKETCREAINKFGKEAQLAQFHEEIGELVTAIARLGRGRATTKDVAEELCDVYLCMHQMMVLFEIDDITVEYFVNAKLHRLQERIKKHGCSGQEVTVSHSNQRKASDV